MTVVSKGEFAKRLGRSNGAVSQWIKNGIIGGDAIVGKGQRAKLNLEIALQQVRERLDVGQRGGNGYNTNLEEGADLLSAAAQEVAEPEKNFPSSSSEQSGGGGLKQPSAADQLQHEKLKKARRDNERDEERRLKEVGIFTSTEEAAAAAVGLAHEFIRALDRAVPVVSQAMAEQFEGVPMRDATLFISKQFRVIRERLSETLELGAQDADEYQEFLHEDDFSERGAGVHEGGGLCD